MANRPPRSLRRACLYCTTEELRMGLCRRIVKNSLMHLQMARELRKIRSLFICARARAKDTRVGFHVCKRWPYTLYVVRWFMDVDLRKRLTAISTSMWCDAMCLTRCLIPCAYARVPRNDDGTVWILGAREPVMGFLHGAATSVVDDAHSSV